MTLSDPVGVEQALGRLFHAYDVRGPAPGVLTESLAARIGRCFAVAVEISDGRGTAVVGHDMRVTSPTLSVALIRGINDAGADVIDIGLAATDMVYFASGHLSLPAVMVTASHNPAGDNGFKLSHAGARPIGRHSGLDGTFPNHPADPLDPANLVGLQASVVEREADLGVAFDGDADRCFVVDERGQVVSPSVIRALIAERELARHPGATILHNVVCSQVVPDVIDAAGGVGVRTPVGHAVIKAAMAEHGAVFGGEHSGHFYFRDFWYADSGMLAALHVLAVVASSQQPLSQTVAAYRGYVASGEINSTVPDPEAALASVEPRLRSQLPAIRADHLDGLTMNGADWWFNLRASNTEPLVRLNVEAEDATTMERVRDSVLTVLRSDR